VSEEEELSSQREPKRNKLESFLNERPQNKKHKKKILVQNKKKHKKLKKRVRKATSERVIIGRYQVKSHRKVRVKKRDQAKAESSENENRDQERERSPKRVSKQRKAKTRHQRSKKFKSKTRSKKRIKLREGHESVSPQKASKLKSVILPNRKMVTVKKKYQSKQVGVGSVKNLNIGSSVRTIKFQRNYLVSDKSSNSSEDEGSSIEQHQI
jgi:hypothetical protein